MLHLLLACHTLDSVPVVEAPHCRADVLGYVVATLDGDTIRVATLEGASVSGGGDTADTGEGEVVQGAVTLLDVRLLGIDAPEIAHDDTEVADCFGPEAEDYVRSMLLGRQVILSFDLTCTDMYDRSLSYVYLTDDETRWELDDCTEADCTLDDDASATAVVPVNEMIVRGGYARVFEEFDDIRLAETYYRAQDAAQAKNQGLWAVCE